jgi:hypothetical protein
MSAKAQKPAWSPSRRGDNGRAGWTNEPNIQNLPRNRRAKPSVKMQRRTVVYRRLHGIGKRGIVSPAATRVYEHNPRLADNGAFAREAGANRDLIVIVRRTLAGRDPRRDAVNAGDQWPLRLSGSRRRPDHQCENSDQSDRSPSG